MIDYKYPDNPAAGFSMWVNGTIKNVASSTTGSWTVYVTGYDSNGAMIGSTYDHSDPLAPDAVHEFHVSVQNDYKLDPAAVRDFAGFAITAQSEVFNETTLRYVGQYTSVSDVTGVVPEFPFVLIVLLFMTAMTAVLALYKKRQP